MPSSREGNAVLESDFYEALFQRALEAGIVIDEHGEVREANQSCVRLLEAEDREDVLGRHFLDFMPAWEAERAGRRFEAAIEGAPKLNTFTIRTDEGNLRMVETIGTPVTSPWGRALFLILRDVTERERAARGRDLVGAIARAANQAQSEEELGGAAMTAAHDILGAHTAFAFAIRGSGQQIGLIGASGLDPSYMADARRHDRPIQGGPVEAAIHQLGPVAVHDIQERDELPAWIRDFTRTYDIDTLVAAPGIVDGEVLSVLVVANSSDRPFQAGDEGLVHQAAQQIALWLDRQRLLGRLERMNRARATALRQIEAQRQELETFTYTVSHDLKEPLRGIEVFTKILLDEYRDEVPADAADLADRTHRHAVRLREMLDDILRLSRATTATGTPSHVDTHLVVDDVLTDLSVTLRERHATVHVAASIPPVRADPTRVREVIANLVGNALKFNDRENPEIWIEGERRKDGMVEVCVADNGPGVPPEEHERVFELFRRGAAGETAPGTGAGLAIVKRILVSYGGEIWITGREGGGAVFHFTLPAAHDETAGNDADA